MEKIPARGRPKTLDRQNVLETAMITYWSAGPAEVSINDICKLTKTSKPAVYREFGRDDGLKLAALQAYRQLAIEPFLDLLKSNLPVLEVLQNVISFLMKDRETLGIPKGCLFVAMRSQRNRLGPSTQRLIDELRDHFLDEVACWIDAVKEKDQFKSNTTSIVASHRFDTLHAGAMRMQIEGVSSEIIEAFLRSELAAFSGEVQILSHPVASEMSFKDTQI